MMGDERLEEYSKSNVIVRIAKSFGSILNDSEGRGCLWLVFKGYKEDLWALVRITRLSQFGFV